MFDEGLGDGEFGSEGFDVLGLHAVGYGEEVFDEMFDYGEEGAVAERPVRASHGPVVGDIWDADGEI